MAPRSLDHAVAPTSILVWLNGALGDTILGFPALAALRSWAPSSAITVVGRPSYLELGRRLGLLDNVEDADGPLALRLFAGRSSPLAFDCAIIWSAAFEQLRVALQSRGVQRVVALGPRGPGNQHQARYLLESLLAAGIDRDRLPNLSSYLRFPTTLTTGADRSECEEVALFHPGSGAHWKLWPAAHYLALATMLRNAGITVRWSFGPADNDLRAALMPEITSAPDGVLENLSLPELCQTLGSSSVVVSGDTGIAHLAAICGVPQVTMFGPTDPRRWRPIGPAVDVIEAPDLCGGLWNTVRTSPNDSCELAIRRCVDQSDATCRCLATLSPERVFARLREILGSRL
jgi:ADP-heptose:LPS heptosyltransferase